jgi:UDP-N-acetylglucosamine--N-acetylmuramyl-(pentapeptide) pyrophosphoryl-undecaprenol N-acetylglucosamine transferase
LLICAGGTGGGVYPALAVLQALNEDNRQGQGIAKQDAGRPQEVLWVGSVGGMEADLVARANVSYKAIPAAGLHGVGWKALPHNLAQLGRGLVEAWRILRAYRPDVLFYTGGFVAAPMALASRLPFRGSKRPSTLLYVPDIEPGQALKLLAQFADQIAVTVKETQAYLPRRSKVLVSGYPTRQSLGVWNDKDARELLGLAPDLPTLLVFGGSKGARSINRALLAALPELLTEMQVVHISGNLDWPEVQAYKENMASTLTDSLLERYKAFAYLHEMGAALSVTDLVVCRAGASTLGEFPLFGLPAVLVPYPHAWRYQQVNAEYLAKQGAAVILQDAVLMQELLPTVHRLFHDRFALSEMSNRMRALAQPKAAHHIAELIQHMAASQRGVR